MERYEIPYVEKMTVSLLILSDVGKEAESLRSTLEYFNYRVDTHWIGSKKELLKILKCEIPTQDLVVINGHGDEKGILMRNEEHRLKSTEIELNCKMKGKTVICTGCLTGTKKLADAFLTGGVINYIAPTDYIDGNSSLMFLYQLFFFLQKKISIKEAVQKAKAFDHEANLYELFSRSDEAF